MYPKFLLTICVTHTYRYIDEYYTPPRKLLSFQNHFQGLACAAQYHGHCFSLALLTAGKGVVSEQAALQSLLLLFPNSCGTPGRYCLFQNPRFIQTIYLSDALAYAVQPYYDG